MLAVLFSPNAVKLTKALGHTNHLQHHSHQQANLFWRLEAQCFYVKTVARQMFEEALRRPANPVALGDSVFGPT